MKLRAAAADQSIFYYGPFWASGRLFSPQDGGVAPVSRVDYRDVRERCVKFWRPPCVGLGGGGRG